MAWHDHSRRQNRQASCDAERWASVHGSDRDEGKCPQSSPNWRRRYSRRLCRCDRRCVHLFERLEQKLERFPNQLQRAAVELAKEWRTEKYLQKLEALLIVADKETTLVITGSGDVLEPEYPVVAVGSGGNYALSAARALVDYEKGRGDARPQSDGNRRRYLRLHQCAFHGGGAGCLIDLIFAPRSAPMS